MPWVTTYTGPAYTAEESAWENYTLRTIIPAASLSQDGSKIRVTLKNNAVASSLYSNDFTSIYVSHAAASGDAYDFDSNWNHLLWGGSSSCTFTTQGQTKLSDEANFNLDKTKNLILAVFLSSSSDGYIGYGTATGRANYYKLGDDALTVNATGYTAGTASRGYLISLIEVFQAPTVINRRELSALGTRMGSRQVRG